MTSGVRIWLLPVLYVCAAGADDSGLHTLAVAAEVAAVAVPPQPAERHFFELPALDYVFRVEARCHSDWKPESLSLNVADTRVTRTAADLENSANQELELKVPSKQLAPVPMRDFCVIEPVLEGSALEAKTAEPDGIARPAPGRMTVGAALSVQASLRCSLGDEQRMIYVSEPLDVTLTCALPEMAGSTASR
jgi:hypothetical protein